MDGGFGEAVKNGDEGWGVAEDGGGGVAAGGGEVGEEAVAPVWRVSALGGVWGGGGGGGGGWGEGAFF